MNRLKHLALGLAIAAMPSMASAQVTIGDPGGDLIGYFGAGSTHTYGQTVTAPVGVSSITDFSFWLYPASIGSFNFNAYVFAWDQTNFRATGGALYTSGLINAPTSGGLTQVNSGPINVAVTPGALYVLAFSFDGNTNSGTGYNPWGYNYGGSYSGGVGTWYNNNVIADLTSHTWDGSRNIGDFQFEANFATVPEPSSMVLLGGGLAALLVAARRRRQRSVV